jgi:biotin carboxyl carrier protein
VEVATQAGLALKIMAQAGAQVHEVVIDRHNGTFVVEVDGVRREVDVRKLESDFYSLVTDGRSYEVSVEARGDAYHVRHGAAELVVRLSDPARGARAGFAVAAGPERVVSVMPGKVVRVLVDEGDHVEPGQGIVVVEAMKMENEIAASKSGCVTSIAVRPGDTVESGAVLAVIE